MPSCNQISLAQITPLSLSPEDFNILKYSRSLLIIYAGIARSIRARDVNMRRARDKAKRGAQTAPVQSLRDDAPAMGERENRAHSFAYTRI